MTINKNSTVTKHNNLVDAGFFKSLSGIEMRIFNLAVSQINPKRPLEQNRKFEFSVKDFLDINNGLLDKDHAYEKIRKAIFNISKVWVEIEPIEGYTKTEIALITSRSYSKGLGEFMIEFNEDVMPYIAQLKNNFTSFLLENFGNLKTEHSLRLYEILSRYSYNGGEILELDYLKRQLGIEGKYKQYKELKRRVLEPAVKEISKKTNLMVSYETIRKGRSINKIKFSIFDKRKAEKIKNEKENLEKRPNFPPKNQFGTYVKLDRQSPKMSSSQYADYAQACLIVLDDFYQDIESVKIEDVRNYYVFLSVNASFKSKIFTKKSAYEEIQKRGYKLVNCELVKE